MPKCKPITMADARRELPGVNRQLPHPVGARVLLAGMREEREHVDILGCSTRLAARVVAAHLKETPRYYRLLANALRKA